MHASVFFIQRVDKIGSGASQPQSQKKSFLHKGDGLTKYVKLSYPSPAANNTSKRSTISGTVEPATSNISVDFAPKPTNPVHFSPKDSCPGDHSSEQLSSRPRRRWVEEKHGSTSEMYFTSGTHLTGVHVQHSSHKHTVSST